MKTTYEFEAIGTSWFIEFDHDDPSLGERVKARIMDRIESFDKAYSRFRSGSLITMISESGGSHVMPEDFETMMSLYLDLYGKTQGAFTPLIGKTMEEAGYDAEYSLKPAALMPVPKMEEVLSYEAPTLHVKKQVVLDFGAAGKGYLVDLVAELLKGEGIERYIVDAGGDIAVYAKDEERVKIGLEHPEDQSLALGVVTIANRSICGSAGNRRVWPGFHHIIDPRTLSSPTKILATWVIADTTILADALATCIYLVSPEILTSTYKFEYLIVHDDYSIELSAGFPGELYTS